MDKRKVFISIPMRGRTVEEIKADMEKIFSKFCDPERDELIDTVIEEDTSGIMRPNVWMLGRSIQLLANANYVIFGPGYSGAPGCMTEGLIALLYHIPHTFCSKSKLNKEEESND